MSRVCLVRCFCYNYDDDASNQSELQVHQISYRKKALSSVLCSRQLLPPTSTRSYIPALVLVKRTAQIILSWFRAERIKSWERVKQTAAFTANMLSVISKVVEHSSQVVNFGSYFKFRLSTPLQRKILVSFSHISYFFPFIFEAISKHFSFWSKCFLFIFVYIEKVP